MKSSTSRKTLIDRRKRVVMADKCVLPLTNISLAISSTTSGRSRPVSRKLFGCGGKGGIRFASAGRGVLSLLME